MRTPEEQYGNVCEPQIHALKEAVDDTKQLVIEIHNAFYVGNGKPSVMVRMDRNERVLKAALWLFGIVVAAFVVAVVQEQI